MIFLETSIFTQLVTEAMDDDSYQKLQVHLVEHPDAGDLIQHSGGLRKIRWAGSGRGKRGGSRVIYYWDLGDRILIKNRRILEYQQLALWLQQTKLWFLQTTQ